MLWKEGLNQMLCLCASAGILVKKINSGITDNIHSIPLSLYYLLDGDYSFLCLNISRDLEELPTLFDQIAHICVLSHVCIRSNDASNWCPHSHPL